MTRQRVLVWGEGPLADGLAQHLASGEMRVARVDPEAEPGAGVERAMQNLGGLDVLVTCPSPGPAGKVDELGGAEWTETLNRNLVGTALACRAALTHMRPQRYGRIVTLADRDYLGASGDGAFGAAAAGVVSLTRTLALEAAPDGVTTNCVVPGTIDLGQIEALPEADRERKRKLQPGGRFGTVADVAAAVLFFAAPESQYITGQTLFVCGGTSVYSSLSV